ncbi:MAG: DMT family transporter [Deltaproteobacteria bacterium]|nr:DMT family transporter [Deltaproteobacteria bacterium]
MAEGPHTVPVRLDPPRQVTDKTPWQRFTTSGPMLLFAASICFAWMAVSVRGLTRFSPSETTFLRFAIGLVVLVIFHRLTLMPLRFVNRPMLVVRGLLGAGAVILYFTCIQRTSAATATLLNNSYPLFAMIAGFFVGTVTVNLRLLALVGMSLAGMVIVANPAWGNVGTGAAYGIASAAMAGAALIVIEKIRETDSAQATFFSMCVGGVIIGLAGMVFHDRGMLVPTGPEWGWIILLGLTSTAAQLMMNHALFYVKATQGSVVCVTTTAFTAVFAYFTFGEKVAWNFYPGAALILTSAVISALTMARHPAERPAEPPAAEPERSAA